MQCVNVCNIPQIKGLLVTGDSIMTGYERGILEKAQLFTIKDWGGWNKLLYKKDISTWAQEHFVKVLSANTVWLQDSILFSIYALYSIPSLEFGCNLRK